MKALITGAMGFAGSYLTDYLVGQTDIAVYGTCIEEPESLPPERGAKFAGVRQVDLREPDAVYDLVCDVKPDMIFHLAAQTYVPASFKDPWDTLENNIRGTLNILEAMRHHAPQSRLLMISSAEVYGAIQPADLPVTERQPYNPASPYSVSKVAQELLGLQYHQAYKLAVVAVRPFNHIGPHQSPRFAIPDFARQIAQMERGLQEPVLHVGNLAAERDFTDVRDIVRAYHLLMVKGEPGQVYNICRGQAFALRVLVEQLIGLADLDIRIQVEQERLRPIDVPRVVGDASRLRDHTGWQPQISIETTLQDVLDSSRARVAAGE